MGVENPKAYQFFKLDDVRFPVLAKNGIGVSCIAYRGTRYYYIEVAIFNWTDKPTQLEPSFISFNKPGYSVMRVNNLSAATDLASIAGQIFVPAPPPVVLPTATTTMSGTAYTYGNMATVTGTATTKYNYSGQQFANGMTALANAIAARRFYDQQNEELRFAYFLAAMSLDQPEQLVVKPDGVQTGVAVFQQLKPKKAPFAAIVSVAGETFIFRYKE